MFLFRVSLKHMGERNCTAVTVWRHKYTSLDREEVKVWEKECRRARLSELAHRADLFLTPALHVYLAGTVLGVDNWSTVRRAALDVYHMSYTTRPNRTWGILPIHDTDDLEKVCDYLLSFIGLSDARISIYT